MRKISIVVPCYNEQDALPCFYKEVVSILNVMHNYDYEILLINDGSKDNTYGIIKSLAINNSKINYISFSRNFGKEAAMEAGFYYATGDLVAVMDADMQDPPSLLPQMISIIENGEYDSVATRRISRNGEPPIRSFFAHNFYKIINRISDINVVDGARDFRLMKRSMVDSILEIKEYNRFSKGIFSWVGFRTYWLSFENVERVAGKTKWNFWKLTKYAIDGIINFSQVPLNIASWFGIGMTVLSCLALIFIVARRIVFGDPVAGWASLVCVMISMCGIQLLCLGIMGTYVAKIYMETKKRPHYIINETNCRSKPKSTL